ncbi:hypothetical protein Bca101_092038 [Brassica carinata]
MEVVRGCTSQIFAWNHCLGLLHDVSFLIHRLCYVIKIAILSTIFADLKSGRYSSSTSIHREGAQVLGSQKCDAPPGC